MSKRIETRLRYAIELQKKYGRKLFCPDNDQWNLGGNQLDNTEHVDNNIASLFAEIESSGELLPESAFYLAAKQLFDCRAMFLCKEEQKRLGSPQELWPKEPYIHPERVVKATFEELYSVEHLATIFRFCEELMNDCKLLFKKKGAELIRDTLEYQLESTREMLERAGYFFHDSLPAGQGVAVDHIVPLVEHIIWE